MHYGLLRVYYVLLGTSFSSSSSETVALVSSSVTQASPGLGSPLAPGVVSTGSIEAGRKGTEGENWPAGTEERTGFGVST